ncbi:LacI family DNA-binding transcriptional regulator [Xanthomonas nasturtii]|uniref:LacI family DNA-binding transcriptional regulator n=1 Tax=Xanthomonas nasturtii TaxID=1843581 RepID=A0ABT0LLY1_9XANT|nr:LacI family DNA-binding transcriptional regulator [Xanthomonas nasturtii]MCL1529935.1 LacI family DNA-binding transcriptional regulator [Xanthomonas nasturtii]MCL1550365.1 LacI family DNA-binding transcriptional regulator [Xanthomonas nasturtii]MCL1554589.1 LacI family DNA-binding transcriptional regulator [Xanthomonas nasturtii]MCL1564697.1 LacI family DNA-binding transcriptional regulator [Xanthomonas nasturtii]MCL1568950.1 LacI family DNA-binding transcriptional regulator [Xanthomonas na
MPMHAHFFQRKACRVTPAKPTSTTTEDADALRVRRTAVTLRDIAGAIGVSRATVSLVLRGSPLVHASTRARVEAELDRQNYVYNRAAANLRRRTSSSIALVINDLSNPFFAEFAAGVDEALGAAGYVTLLGSTGESTQRQQAVLASLMEHTPAGIILSPAEGSQAQALTQVLGRQRNVVLFNREVEGTHWDLLALDNAQGALLACTHLIAQGHRRIVFFGGHAESSSCRQRRAGYARAMEAAGLETHYVESAPNRQDAALCGARMLGSAAQAATAAVCYNDSVALGLMAALAMQGIVPGRDFAVTGFDDIAEAALFTPALTTLAADPRARGRQAAQLVLQRIGSPDLASQQLTAAVALKIRASSACAPSAQISASPPSSTSARSPTKASGR